MPAGTSGLARQHRAGQLRLRARFLQEFSSAWSVLNPRSLDTTGPIWLAMVLPLIVRFRNESASGGVAFYNAIRQTRTGQLVSPPVPRIDWSPADSAAQVSMRVLGPVQIKSLTHRHPDLPAEKLRTAHVSAAAGATRHVLDGARTATVAAAGEDELAVGFARYASGTACAFCKMLAGRGAVYKSERTAQFTSGGQRYHDGCVCLPVPVFSHTDPLPPGGDDYARLWAETTAGLTGKAARNAFRRAVEGHTDPTGAAAAR